MRRTESRRLYVHRVLPSACAAAFITAIACAPPGATPAPPFSGQNIGTVSDSAMLAYGASLRFDTVLPRADTAMTRLSDGSTDTLLIASELGSGALTHADLVAGRIIARVTSTASYDTLGLRKGTNYLWTDSSALGWRQLIFSLHSERQPVQSVVIHMHWWPLAWSPRSRFLRAHGLVVGMWTHVFKGCVGGGRLRARVDAAMEDAE